MIIVEFKLEKETKNAVRFAEVLASEPSDPKVGTLYVPKRTLAAMKWDAPKRLKVTLEVE